MENQKNIVVSENQKFSEEYFSLLSTGRDNNSVVVNTEWTHEGDNFKKFSLYDNNYSPVRISSSTTLISEL